MKRITYSYALATALYDEGQDYLDAFWPLVVQAFPQSGRVMQRGLRDILRDEHGLKIPSHALRLLLYRARQHGLVERRRSNGSYALTPEGRSYRDELETPREVERRISELMEDGVRYFAAQGNETTVDVFSELLLGFVESNLDPLISFIGSEAKCTGEYAASKDEERLLLAYIEACEESRPSAFKTLLDILRGSILSSVICSQKTEEFEELQNADLSTVSAYLDTNILLPVLGYESDEVVEAAQEVMALLRTSDCRVLVFPFTVTEICGMLGGYERHESDYWSDVAVRTAYSQMRSKGLRRSDVRDAISNIEELIASAGIEIAAEPDIDLTDYLPQDERVLRAIRKYKKALQRVENHDLAAVEAIRTLRGHTRARKLQDAVALFVSSDVRLSQASFAGLGHRRAGTVAEVIHDSILASILWLRLPTATPPLKSIVATYSRNLFVEKRVWERFLEVVLRLKEQGEVDEDDLANLLYRDYISSVLMDIDKEDVGRVSRDFILAEVEKAREARAKQEAKNIETLRAEHSERLKVVSRNIDAAWRLRIQGALAQIEQECLTLGRKTAIGMCVICTAAYLALVGLTALWITGAPIGLGSALAFGIAVVIPGSVLGCVWGKVRPWVAERLAQWLCARNRERRRLLALADAHRGLPNQEGS